MGERQLMIFDFEEKSVKKSFRTPDGKYSTKRESDLRIREKKCSRLERQAEIDKRKIEALTQLVTTYKTEIITLKNQHQ